MTATLSVLAPLVVVGVAVPLRRKVGPWASWLFLTTLVFLVGRYGVGPVFWNKPAFLASMSEDLGAMFALLVLALVLAEWKRDRPTLVVQLLGGALLVMLVQWALARWPIPDVAGKGLAIAILLWILAQGYRGARYLFRHRSPDITPVFTAPTDATEIQ
ncbi:MAG: hypothetical protein ABI679_08540 [Gemmatimonadota bacterium]